MEKNKSVQKYLVGQTVWWFDRNHITQKIKKCLVKGAELHKPPQPKVSYILYTLYDKNKGCLAAYATESRIYSTKSNAKRAAMRQINKRLNKAREQYLSGYESIQNW
jgi:hypothetical protein